MITILHTESSSGWGGQENRTLQECIGLKKLGARTIILCQPESILSRQAAKQGIEVRTCRMKKSYDISAIRYMLNLIKTDAIDIINTHSGRDSLLAGIAGRLSRKKPKIVRTRHLALPITSRVKYSLLPHRIITVSESVRQHLIKRGIAPEKITSVLTGADLNRFAPEKITGGLRQELNLEQDTVLVGTIAILRYRKGHHILLDAVPLVTKKIPKAVFVFAGDGPQKENILKKIHDAGISDRVFMLGLREDIPEILKSIDVFVLPTLQEALGTSFIEAMAMGKPVIGTDVDGVSEVIKNGLNGYLIKPNDPSMLAEAIIDLLTDTEKANKMGLEGKKIVQQNFTVEKMCKNIYSLYSSLIEKKSS